MATINASISINSDIMGYPVAINKTTMMKKAGSCHGLEKTLGVSYAKYNATTAVVLELAADAADSKANKVYIRNTGSDKSAYFHIALNVSAAADNTTQILGRLYGGDWMLMPWDAAGTGHNIVVAPSTAETMTLEWVAFVE
jgi:hypothetical protein